MRHWLSKVVASIGLSVVVVASQNQAAAQYSESGSNQTVPMASAEWPSFGNNTWQDRFSPLTDITPANAAALRLVYQSVIPDSFGVNESYPLELGGIMYVTTSEAHVIAINASTGRILWQFAPRLQLLSGIPKLNRGVALGLGNVYVLTPDDRLIALRQSNGKLLFDVTVADESKGYFESMAPQFADGKIIVGSSGGDEGIRGFVAAYSATSGKRLWQFYTIPPRGQGWVAATGDHGGGAVWTTPSYDEQTQSVYFGTGNPSPDYFGGMRLGPNPYTDSVVNLGLSEGKLQWYQQEVSHDLWDYDVASPPLLFPVQGRTAIGEAGKDGYWHEWDATTGKLLVQPVAFVKENHRPPTPNGVEEWPGSAGGANYGPSAFDPKTHSVFIAGINGPETVFSNPTSHHGYRVDLGTYAIVAPKAQWTGTITAVDVVSGKQVWQVKTPTPPIGGVTVDAGGVVFFGQQNGWLEALSTSSGKLLWKTQVGSPISSAPIVYQAGGRTYVSVVTGGAGSMEGLFPWTGINRVLTFAVSRLEGQ